MKVPGLQWLAEKLLDRMRALIWGMLASDVETEAVLHRSQNLSRIEDYARQLEEEGKAQQAEILRQQAARITSDSPAGTAVPLITNLADDEAPRLNAPAESNTGDGKASGALPAPSRSRPRSRSSSSRRSRSRASSTKPDGDESSAKE